MPPDLALPCPSMPHRLPCRCALHRLCLYITSAFAHNVFSIHLSFSAGKSLLILCGEVFAKSHLLPEAPQAGLFAAAACAPSASVAFPVSSPSVHMTVSSFARRWAWEGLCSGQL